MQSSTPNLFTRPDTFFGVCEGLGEDLRIHANLFRLAFAALLFWNPPAALAAYATAGAVVAVSRLLYPNPVLPAAPEATVCRGETVQGTVEQSYQEEPAAMAA